MARTRQRPSVLDESIVRTKLHHPPPRRDELVRARLVEHLTSGTRGPLTLVAAPAGFGKTSLVSTWRAGCPAAVAWLALESGDSDLARFLRYVIAALRTIKANLGTGVLATLRSLQRPAAESLMALLINELAVLSEEIVLVLDDYHVIEEPAIHQALAYLLDHLPSQLHLVIVTRADPPLPLSRLRAGGHLTEIREADLRFTAEEASAFFGETMGVELSAAHVATLTGRTEGWITGLQLAGLSLRAMEGEEADVLAFITAFSGSHRYVVDYLAEEVLNRLPEQVQAFLLSTSILDRLSGDLCDAVLEHPDSQSLLEWLERVNLFLIALDDERRWYRYHHLFADFLRERLRRAQPAQLAALHRRACRWHEEHGQPAEAAQHALAAGEVEVAARLLEGLTGALLWQRGEPTTVSRWLERLPATAIQMRPRLCLDQAWALLWRGQIAAIEPCLQPVERSLEIAGTQSIRPPIPEPGSAMAPPVQALRGEVATMRAVLARYHGNAEETVALARTALALLPPQQGLLRGIATGLRGVGCRLQGDLRAADQAFTEAAQLSQQAGNSVTALIALGRAVDAQVLGGHLRRASATYQQALDLAAECTLAACPALGIALVAMGGVLYEWGDVRGAEHTLRQGIAACEQWLGVLAEFAVDGWLRLAAISRARGNFGAALEQIERAQAIARRTQSSFDSERVAAARAVLWLAEANLPEAARWLAARREALPFEGAFSEARLDEYLVAARVLGAQGEFERAAQVLTRLLPLAEAQGAGRLCTKGHLALALIQQARGRLAEAREAVERALALAEPEGYVRLFVDEGAAVPTVLRLVRGAHAAYARRLLQALGTPAVVAAPAALAGMPGLIEPLSARELEVLRLLAQGHPTAEIADLLVVAPGTVKNHLKHIFGKLGAHARLQAVERARALDLL
jgi:LuxR family maltose regulon positive regulatory protein